MIWQDTHIKTFRTLTGISEEAALKLFLQSVRVTIDPQVERNRTYQWAAWFAANILSRTFPNTTAELPFELPLPGRPTDEVTDKFKPALTLHFGSGAPAPDRVIANCHDWQVLIDNAYTADSFESWNPCLALLTGAYAASRVTNMLLRNQRQPWREFSILDFRDVTANVDWDAPLNIGNVHLAGVGAVGCAALYALSVHGSVSGTLTLVDHECLDEGNLRYVLFTSEDIPHGKAARAADKIRPQCQNLNIHHEPQRFEHYFDRGYDLDKRFRIERLITAPDQRPTRRAFQARLPRQLWDGSTGPDQVVLHHNSYNAKEACAACVYSPIPEEDAHARHVANALHLPIERIQSREAITELDSKVIHRAYPNLSEGALLGRAFDSVFRQLCGAGTIRIENVHVLAPLPYISALAGVMLYLEFLKTLMPQLSRFQKYNYTQIDPSRTPNPDFRFKKPPLSNCDCQRAEIRRAFEKVWTDSFP
jgi:hypothetical protein